MMKIKKSGIVFLALSKYCCGTGNDITLFCIFIKGIISTYTYTQKYYNYNAMDNIIKVDLKKIQEDKREEVINKFIIF